MTDPDEVTQYLPYLHLFDFSYYAIFCILIPDSGYFLFSQHKNVYIVFTSARQILFLVYSQSVRQVSLMCSLHIRVLLTFIFSNFNYFFIVFIYKWIFRPNQWMTLPVVSSSSKQSRRSRLFLLCLQNLVGHCLIWCHGLHRRVLTYMFLNCFWIGATIARIDYDHIGSDKYKYLHWYWLLIKNIYI